MAISIEKYAARLVMAITFVIVVAILIVLALLDLRATRSSEAANAAAATPRIERELREGDLEHTLDGLDSIAGAQLHGADGRVVGRVAQRAPESGVAARVANWIAPAEIVCSPASNGGTICVEQAPLTARAALWLRLLAAGALVALIAGALAAWGTRRAIASRLTPLGATVDRAIREHDYSQRLPEPAGALGSLSSSVNALLGQMQDREVTLKRRTIEVEEANRELESFVSAVSHDLRAPLGAIEGFSQALREDWYERLDTTGRECLDWIGKGCVQMRNLIESLLQMSRLGREAMHEQDVDLTALARSVAEALKLRDPERPVDFVIGDGLRAHGDERLLRAVLENLMGNAWKFTRGRDVARIEFGLTRNGGEQAFYVRDNGAGFDASHAAKMFRPFQRLHAASEFEGTGIGLATVQKIISRHGGRAWAQGAVGEGATVYFTVAS